MKKITINEKDVGEDYFKVLKDVIAIRVKRNKIYGSNFDFPVENYAWHAFQKVHRALYILKHGRNNYESLKDTLIDLTNYSLFALIATNKEKEKQNDEENSTRKKS